MNFESMLGVFEFALINASRRRFAKVDFSSKGAVVFQKL